MPLFGSSNKELQFTMYSTDKQIQENPKEDSEFDIFTYKPTADTKTQAGKPLWFSVGGFVKLEKGEIFKGAFKDKGSNSEKHFIGKFDHAIFYTPKFLGLDKPSKTHNDVAVTFEIMNIGTKDEIETKFNGKTVEDDNKVNPDSINSIKFCSVASDKNKKLISIHQTISTFYYKCNNVKSVDDTRKSGSESSDKNTETSNKKYIISNLVISSDKGGMFGTTIEADDVFLQSLVPTKPEEQPAADGQTDSQGTAAQSEAGQPGTAPRADDRVEAGPAAAQGATQRAKLGGNFKIGGRKRKSGKKKRKSIRRRKTKRNSRIRR